MKSHHIFCSVLLALVLVSSTAVACDCRTGSLTERVARAQIVFVAAVTDFEPLHHVTLRSKEVFKGRPGPVLTIATGVSDCDFFLPPVNPRVGEEFLLYVGQLDGRPYASICQNSGLIAERAAELAELRRRSRSNAQPINPQDAAR
jgi:hypothetical protein